jgi:HEAT repeat protein
LNTLRRLAFVLLGLSGLSLSAAAAEWQGRVIAQSNRQPLEGAVVAWEKTYALKGQDPDQTFAFPMFTVSDQDGRFRVLDPADGLRVYPARLPPDFIREACWVFRPGYEATPIDRRGSEVTLAKVKTSSQSRCTQLMRFKRGSGYDSPDTIAHPAVRAVVQKEMEFQAGWGDSNPHDMKPETRPDPIPRAVFPQPSPRRIVPDAIASQVKLVRQPCDCATANPIGPERSASSQGVSPGQSFAMTLRQRRQGPPLPAGLSDDEVLAHFQAESSGSGRIMAAAELGRRKILSAVPLLLEAYAHESDPGIRSALRCALRCMGVQALPLIAQVIQDGDESLVRNIPMFLGDFPPREAEPLLIRLADHRDPDTRYLAVVVLSRNRRPRLIPIFLAAYCDADKRIQNIAQHVLWAFEDSDRVGLIEGAGHADPQVRMLALTLLAEEFPETAGPTLREALLDADPDVRIQALLLARHIPDGQAVQVIQKALATGDLKLRRIAVQECVRSDIASAGKMLVRLLEDDVHPLLRQDAMMVLCRRDESEGLTYVSDRLPHEKTPELYTKLLIILTDSRNPKAIPILLPALSAASLTNKRYALEALSHIATPRAIEIIIGSTEDSDPEVRKAAFTSLAAAREAVFPFLGVLQTHRDTYIRWRTARMLGNMPSPPARTILIPYGLSAAKPPADDPILPLVFGHLEKSLQDPAPEVRYTALNSFSRGSRLEGALNILPLLDDPDEGIQESALARLNVITGPHPDFGYDKTLWQALIRRQLAAKAKAGGTGLR